MFLCGWGWGRMGSASVPVVTGMNPIVYVASADGHVNTFFPRQCTSHSLSPPSPPSTSPLPVSSPPLPSLSPLPLPSPSPFSSRNIYSAISGYNSRTSTIVIASSPWRSTRALSESLFIPVTSHCCHVTSCHTDVLSLSWYCTTFLIMHIRLSMLHPHPCSSPPHTHTPSYHPHTLTPTHTPSHPPTHPHTHPHTLTPCTVSPSGLAGRGWGLAQWWFWLGMVTTLRLSWQYGKWLEISTCFTAQRELTRYDAPLPSPHMPHHTPTRPTHTPHMPHPHPLQL